MKKNKNAIHLAGVGNLLKLLMYDDYRNFKFKYYIIKNKYEEKNNNFRYLKNLKFQKQIVSAIKKKMKVDIEILENAIETNIFLSKQKKIINYSTKSSIFVDDDDLIVNHLFNYLKKHIKGKKISFITEGIGLFQIGKKKTFINIFKKYLVLAIKFFLSKLSLFYYPKAIIVFSDPNQWIEKFLKSYLLPYDKVIVLNNKSTESFTEKYFDIFSDLSKDFLYFFKLDYQVFHPLLKRSSLEEATEVLKKILNETSGNILVKKHPSDYRDFSSLKKISKRIILLSDDLSPFLGEIFIKNKTKYYGDYSSIMLSVNDNNINHITIKNSEYNQWKKIHFKNFNKIFNKEL
jgi:hypothetical protein